MPETTEEGLVNELPEVEEEEEEEPVCEVCRLFTDDCRCRTCGGCDDLVEHWCSNCDECDDCCSCSRCEGCDENVGRLSCSDCNRCEHCGCECEEEDEEEGQDDPFGCSFRKRGREPHESHEFVENPLRRFLGCELEIAGLNAEGNRVDAVCEAWGASVVYDGSLPDKGFEVVTAPRRGDDFLKQIRELCKALTAQEAYTTRSCGYHLHVDCRDLSCEDVRRLALLYAGFEDALFECVPASRRNNHFCKKEGDEIQGWLNFTGKAQDQLEQLLYDGTWNCSAVKKNRRHGKRYAALNLHSYFYRGTVECRLAAGTTDPVKIINWALLWGNLVERAKGMKDGEVKDHAGWEGLLSLCPNDEIRGWLKARKRKFRVNLEGG